MSEGSTPRRSTRRRGLLLPRLVRRVLVAPALVVGTVLLFATLPLWIIVASFASRFVPGRWRILRVAWFLFVYVLWASIGLVALFAMWVAAGFGRSIRSPAWTRRHYRFAAWWLGRVMGSARRTFRLHIEREVDEEIRAASRPVLVFSRHAGPGDSLLLVDALLNQTHRTPRIVLKDLVQLDPVVDVLMNRLPTCFVPSRGRDTSALVESIGKLAEDMTGRDALVLFPEGGNFTAGRRARAIEQLAGGGREDLSERAQRMRHVLPPKPRGALRAIDAAPGADVVFVGHVGLEQLSTVRDLWRGIPLDAAVRARLWRIPAEEVPPEAERETWLYDQWQLIDDWIDEVSGGAADERPASEIAP